MRAIVCRQWGPPASLEVCELPDPQAGPGQVLIRVEAAGLNFPDTLIIQGKYQFRPELPFVPGSELAGVVQACGEGVQHLQPGQKVIAFTGQGAFASLVSVDARLVLPMPDGMDFETAAAFTLTYGTSWHALADRAALQAGETLLVLGASGGVGLAAIEIGKALGARVVAAASSAAKLEICRQHGADACINYSEQDLRSAIRDTCGDSGPQVIYDPVGGNYSEAAFRSIAWRGRYLVVGFANGEIPKLPLNLALLKGASLVGVFWGEFVKREPKANLAGMRTLLGWLQQGQLRPHISARYPLAQTGQAMDAMIARNVSGKVLILPQQ